MCSAGNAELSYIFIYSCITFIEIPRNNNLSIISELKNNNLTRTSRGILQQYPANIIESGGRILLHIKNRTPSSDHWRKAHVFIPPPPKGDFCHEGRGGGAYFHEENFSLSAVKGGHTFFVLSNLNHNAYRKYEYI